jgi:hypothetical protein
LVCPKMSFSIRRFDSTVQSTRTLPCEISQQRYTLKLMH